MRNNKLKKDFKKIGFAIFTFFFWYIVVGFCLKSDYPIQEQPFNGVTAYELIRDGLTLSAYFLAPAVAFLLFSDWREEHKEVTLEKNTQESYQYLNDSFKAILEFKYEVCKGDKLGEDRCLGVVSTKDKILYLIDFAERSLAIIDNDTDVKQFEIKSKEIARLLKSCVNELYELDLRYQKSQSNYCPDFNCANAEIKEINQKLNELSIELRTYKV